MAVDMFLKLSGIKGEAKDDKHKDEIDIYSWSWGLSQQGSFGMGGGGGSGKVEVHDIMVTKKHDAASAKLMLDCAGGEHIPDGLLTVRKAGGEPLEYLKIKMTDIIVSSVQIQGAAHDDHVMETVNLNFAKYEATYTEQDEKGKAKAPVVHGWDVKANKKV